ncbi:MAG: zf-TFIIB domain-containing protein [Sedimentisphaerales bacterium]|nr:zf-TFIIB domain-containing protein [Sedimentisphaerales bacterium]
MDCPLCKNPMVVLELDCVETDYCTDCGGIWLDAGELEMLFADSAQAGELVSSFKPAEGIAEKPCRCPICLKKMQKIIASSGDKPVIIDRCPKEHGLWFDRGELSQILAKGTFDKERKVIKLLTEMFNQNGNEENNGN